MSEKFINKCEVCQHFNGSKHVNQPWGALHAVNCDLGVNSCLERGCSNFYPVRNGCQVDCYLRKGASIPTCGYNNISIMQGISPCFAYAKLDFEGDSRNKKGCFISTAVCKTKNLPDNCDELTTLRYFRDCHLLSDKNTQSLVYEYYEKSPKLVYKVENNDELGLYLYENYLIDIVNMIKNQDNKQNIIDKYQAMFHFLENFKA